MNEYISKKLENHTVSYALKVIKEKIISSINFTIFHSKVKTFETYITKTFVFYLYTFLKYQLKKLTSSGSSTIYPKFSAKENSKNLKEKFILSF